MGTASWALPVGILAGLCGCMFIFIWWWFPRMYRRGVRADMDRVDEDNRMRDIHDAEQRELEAADGNAETGEDGVRLPPPTYAGAAQPGRLPKTFKYTPPAYTAY